jgi:hypothetical protein
VWFLAKVFACEAAPLVGPNQYQLLPLLLFSTSPHLILFLLIHYLIIQPINKENTKFDFFPSYKYFPSYKKKWNNYNFNIHINSNMNTWFFLQHMQKAPIHNIWYINQKCIIHLYIFLFIYQTYIETVWNYIAMQSINIVNTNQNK